LIEQSEIVMNKLPLMTAWCRITTLEVRGLSGFHGHKTPETFPGMLEGVLGQSAGSLTHLDLDSNALGSDGVRRLAGVLAQCTALRYLSLSSNEMARAAQVALPEALAHCRALNHLNLSFNWITTHGAKSLAGL
jgi:Ran GTPase-activating protein (RanGAP) involved in mRNA processing and transport